MKRIRIIGLALVALFAFSAIAASAAQAEPEWKPKGGSSAFPVKFSATGTKETFLETTNHGQIKCSGLTAKGELKVAREAGKIVVKFTGCKAEKFGAGECKTAGKAAGEIETKSLKAKPVFIEGKTKAKEERGLDISPETVGPFAEFECKTLLKAEKLRVENLLSEENSLVCRIPAADVGVQVETGKVICKQTKGEQSPKEYEELNAAKTAFVKLVDFLETEGLAGSQEVFKSELSGEGAEETVTYAGKETVELT
jgi:hypothetical protein